MEDGNGIFIIAPYHPLLESIGEVAVDRYQELNAEDLYVAKPDDVTARSPDPADPVVLEFPSRWTNESRQQVPEPLGVTHTSMSQENNEIVQQELPVFFHQLPRA